MSGDLIMLHLPSATLIHKSKTDETTIATDDDPLQVPIRTELFYRESTNFEKCFTLSHFTDGQFQSLHPEYSKTERWFFQTSFKIGSECIPNI